MEEKRDPETYAIIGAGMAVHCRLGSGFLEPVYHESLGIELEILGIPNQSEPPLTIRYRDRVLEKKYQPDYICYETVIVELKALSQLTEKHVSQVLNYLKCTGLTRGLFLNFGGDSLEYRHIVFNHSS